ncbi:MAG TPA: BrnT family toxin [Candidatus Omnitrophota bacterium]|nr:BrnT family toxin [Candidatus Omnitrophota bacterium]
MIKKRTSSFVWDPRKELVNIYKHGVNFNTAAKAFRDPHRKVYIDSRHSQKEQRYFCIGKIKNKILTVRFMYRAGKIRIIGAGYWRKGERYYEKESTKGF